MSATAPATGPSNHSRTTPHRAQPPYVWLTRDDMDRPTVSRKLAVLAAPPLCTPCTACELTNAETDACAQAAVIATELRQHLALAAKAELEKKRVIALISHLKRLGRDVHHLSPTPAAAGH